MKTYEIRISVLGPEEFEVTYGYYTGTFNVAVQQVLHQFNISAFRVGPRGLKGDTGDPGIIVSPTPPANPRIGQLWLDTSSFN